MKSPKVSIIIAIYNEAKHLKACLQSLFSQDYPNLEIIVVDDGSTDSSPTIAKSFDNLTLLSNTHQGPASSRNLGAAQAHGKILVFLDGDMTFSPQFVSKLVDPIIAGKTIGTFSSEEYVANTDKFWSQSWSVVHHLPINQRHQPNSLSTHPVFRAILKSAFNSVGGYDTTLGYDDDWSLFHRLGKPAHKAPGAIYYHYNPESLHEFFDQAVWSASRQYKLGIFGQLVAITRSFLPISVIKATIQAVKHHQPTFFFSQLLYDSAIILGIIRVWFSPAKK